MSKITKSCKTELCDFKAMTLNKIIIASLMIILINNAKYLYDYLLKTDTNHIKDHKLYLTPFLKNGKFDEAHKLAVVNHKEMFNIESYSGYLTVDEQYNSNLFFQP
ncbi:hypothetical protein KQX54_006451 [Cotesia glomerata]|uniref:Uncharacterized protein n=1 Tax=Cotesia glomerata TaxID=32391 RepID=A0AAV7IT53_COTGL|nr:hypothetical protein KQX54_006451 [Cotesia glomerata]